MKDSIVNIELISKCGLYCGTCKRYLKEKCPGCSKNEKASWCKIRSCCLEHSYQSCADCKEFDDPKNCKKFNNFIGNLFGLIFRSDRIASINYIKKHGAERYATRMVELKQMVIKRGQKLES